MLPETIRWEGDAEHGHAVLLDQTRLPREIVHCAVRTSEEMAEAIRRLAIRGAPAIGVGGALGLVLAMQRVPEEDAHDFVGRAREAAAWLARSRPTAVNLAGALGRLVRRAEQACARGAPPRELRGLLLDEAQALLAEERAACESMGLHGAELLASGMAVLTHCNAGALATVGIGTALAPLYVAARAGKRVSVFACETRPLLQGARLTAWELARSGLSVTLIADAAAGSLFQRGAVQAVFVGADRIARNGDVANKIGTYPLAVLARRHAVPFYVVAPLSTFDARAMSGDDIPIEERDAREVTELCGVPVAAEGVQVFNPAFDVTPAELLTAIVSERGVLRAPNGQKLESWLGPAG